MPNAGDLAFDPATKTWFEYGDKGIASPITDQAELAYLSDFTGVRMESDGTQSLQVGKTGQWWNVATGQPIGPQPSATQQPTGQPGNGVIAQPQPVTSGQATPDVPGTTEEDKVRAFGERTYGPKPQGWTGPWPPLTVTLDKQGNLNYSVDTKLITSLGFGPVLDAGSGRVIYEHRDVTAAKQQAVKDAALQQRQTFGQPEFYQDPQTGIVWQRSGPQSQWTQVKQPGPESMDQQLSGLVQDAIVSGNWDKALAFRDFQQAMTPYQQGQLSLQQQNQQFTQQKAAFDMAMQYVSSPGDYMALVGMLRGQLPAQQAFGTYGQVAPPSNAFGMLQSLGFNMPFGGIGTGKPGAVATKMPAAQVPPVGVGGQANPFQIPQVPQFPPVQVPGQLPGAPIGNGMSGPTQVPGYNGSVPQGTPAEQPWGPAQTEGQWLTQRDPNVPSGPGIGEKTIETPAMEQEQDRQRAQVVQQNTPAVTWKGFDLTPEDIALQRATFAPKPSTPIIQGQPQAQGAFSLPASGYDPNYFLPYAVQQVGLGGHALGRSKTFPDIGGLAFPSAQSWNNMNPMEQQMFQKAVQLQGIPWADYQSQMQKSFGALGAAPRPTFDAAMAR